MPEPTRDDLRVDRSPGYKPFVPVYKPVSDDELAVMLRRDGWMRLPTCETCGGMGIDGSTYVPATHLSPSEAEPCPRCGGSGLAFDREKLRKAADVVASHEDSGDHVWPVAITLAAAARLLLDATEEER